MVKKKIKEIKKIQIFWFMQSYFVSIKKENKEIIGIYYNIILVYNIKQVVGFYFFLFKLEILLVNCNNVI